MDPRASMRDPVHVRSWLRYAFTYLYVFRAVVVSICLTLALIGWFSHVDWLFNASLCIAIGELVESSYYITVMRWGQRTGRLPAG